LGGQAGLYRATGTEVAHEFDDVKIWLDHDADGTLDAGDEVPVADTYNRGALTLSYDDNGSLTDDGILAYVDDDWNRMPRERCRNGWLSRTPFRLSISPCY
jgi:hypothetical protein